MKQTTVPVVPIGHDAHRMWERWPYQRIGMRTYMRSIYDRAGGNEMADAGLQPQRLAHMTAPTCHGTNSTPP
jgi:hypothetical protein